MTDKSPVKLFVHSSGSYIAAQEIKRKSGTSIEVKYPAFVQQNANAVGFKFEPLQFVVDEFELYTGSFLGEMLMPDIMLPFYERYVAEREKENEAMPR